MTIAATTVPFRPAKRRTNKPTTSTPAPNDVFAFYLAEIAKTPLLSKAEEITLGRQIHDADTAISGPARKKLIAANLRLVVSIARIFIDRGMSLDDLVSSGNIGLCRAVGHFNLSHGVRFCTYATYWIKQSINQSMVADGLDSVARLPMYMHDLIGKRKRIIAHLASLPGRNQPVEDAEVWSALGVTKKKARNASAAIKMRSMARISEAPGYSSEVADYLDVAAVDRSEPVDLAVSDAEERQIVMDRLDELIKRKAVHRLARDVLSMRHGLVDGEARTLDSIGKRFGKTREWIRRIESEAIEALKQEFVGREA